MDEEIEEGTHEKERGEGDRGRGSKGRKKAPNKEAAANCCAHRWPWRRARGRRCRACSRGAQRGSRGRGQ